MGEVYRARDTRLDRDVAIKVLPSHLSSDADALARFEREAKAVAALSHPNILAIHDVGSAVRAEPPDDAARSAHGTISGTASATVHYAVMELLEGTTLRARLADGALPQTKTARIGVDLAHGLAAAHARGLVHRDLKPENVFITNDGRVKILDFGLAKQQGRGGHGGREAEGGGYRGSEASATQTQLAETTPGTILGTIGYMSPEQVRGQASDHRSDVFALGAVLFEMATGRRAFARETSADTMTAILREDPLDPTSSSPGASGVGATPVPAALEPIIRHCLEKQPDERFQSARDLAFALQSMSISPAPSSGASGAQAAGAAASASAAAGAGASNLAVERRIPLGLIAAAIILVAAAYFAGRYWPGNSRGAAATTSTLSFQQVTDDAGMESQPSLSPDGASIAFTRGFLERGADIFLQRVGGRTAIPIATDPGLDEGAPAFSPDGSSIAFHITTGRGGIFVAGATGESARRVTDFGFHPMWSPDNQRLVFCTEGIITPLSRSSTSALWTVDAKGSTAPVKLYDGDAVEPAWSPNNRRIAFWAALTGTRDLFTIPVDGGAPVAVTNDAAVDWGARWSGDGRYLYFTSDRGGAMNIWRIRIDESTGVPQGQPEPVTQGVTAAEHVTVARDGSRIAFRSSQASTNPAAIAFDETAERLGAPKLLIDRTGNLLPTAVSPDGKWLAYWNIGDHQEDIFVSQTDGTGLRRVTDDAARDRLPVWSDDGREILFYSNRGDQYNIFSVRADGSGLRAITERTGGNHANLLYPVMSPAGDRLIASAFRSDDNVLIDPRKPWSAQTPDKLPMRVRDDAWLVPSQWSPDGQRLLGAVVNTSGAPMGLGVYDFGKGQARVVSTDVAGFFGFAWLSDSRRAIYFNGDHIVLLDVDSGRRRVIPSGQTLGFGMAMAPDRKTLYISVARQQADIWVGK